jgi:hypothetical protein
MVADSARQNHQPAQNGFPKITSAIRDRSPVGEKGVGFLLGLTSWCIHGASAHD